MPHPASERILEPGALAQAPAVLARHGIGFNVVLTFDELTWVAAGKAVESALTPNYRITPHSLGHEAHAELAHAEALIRASGDVDGFVAVGSGTINDITKYAAAKLGKPYVSIATAASMNGYTSANASLLDGGHKHSFEAVPPRAVIADLAVIASAPLRLARSGLGDTLCRSTVETDMLLSHFLLGTPYPQALFERQRSHEAVLIEEAKKLPTRDISYIKLLMQALLDSGDAMTESGSSAVASQGEHMIGHTAELLYARQLAPVRHGELIAVTTLTIADQQEHHLMRTAPSVKSLPQLPSLFLKHFGQYHADRLMEAYKTKVLSPTQAKEINIRLARDWPDMRAQIMEIFVPKETLETALRLAGTPTRCYDIKLDISRYKQAVAHAYLTRERFTFLDLTAMAEKKR